MGNITFRWLGISGVELTLGGHTVLIDPLYTQVPLGRVLFSPLCSDRHAVLRQCDRCDALFISHAHYDHLLDAPDIARRFCAPLHGSANTCAIAGQCGVPEALLHRLAPGAAVACGPWQVTAYLANHVRLPLHGAGPAPRGTPPFRSRQYRMDGSLSFLFSGNGRRLLAGPGVCGCDAALDVLFCSPTTGYEPLEALLRATRPTLFVPIHWDNLFRRNARRPGLDPTHPPQRFDMDRLQQMSHACGARCLLPERLRRYSLNELLP